MPRSTLLWFGKPNTLLNIFVICCHVKWTSSRNKRFKSEFFFSPSHGLRCVTHSHIDPQTSRVKVFQWLHSCDSLSRPWKHSLHDATLNTPHNHWWILNVPLALHHPLLLETCFPTNAHNGLGDSDASSLLTVCREQKRGCVSYRCRAETSTHTYTHRKWYVCLCDKQCVCTLGWRACREEHSYNRIARGGGNVSFPHSSWWTSLLFLDFGCRDPQADQSARGIPASGVV